jgi:hypothetical protein
MLPVIYIVFALIIISALLVLFIGYPSHSKDTKDFSSRRSRAKKYPGGYEKDELLQ